MKAPPDDRGARDGFWYFDRAFFEEVGRACGWKARSLMIELVNDAAVEFGVRSLSEGTTIALQRGDAFATGDRLAARIGSSPSTISRLLTALEEHGFIRKRAKAWLKDGRGRVPMIVSVCEYERFAAPPKRREPPHERTVGKKEEKHHLGRNGVSRRGEPRDMVSAAKRQEGADVLAFYRYEINEECRDEEYTLMRAAEVVSLFGADAVKRAARSQAEAGHRWRADDFFEVMANRGLPGQAEAKDFALT
jgi:DNA-binding transcriptional ArsR family regulator